MRTENGYRFTLQFPCKTDQQRYIGEHLERLGSKKSSFIVKVLNEYLTHSPEQAQAGVAGLSRDDLKDVIREVLAERGMVIQLPDEPQPAEASETNVDAMLDFMGFIKQ